MSVYTKLACFAGGALFGSFGIKLLSSKDAKKAYVHVTAAGLRMKDSVMGTVTTVQENAADILASAKELNEDRAAKEAVEAELKAMTPKSEGSTDAGGNTTGERTKTAGAAQTGLMLVWMLTAGGALWTCRKRAH